MNKAQLHIPHRDEIGSFTHIKRQSQNEALVISHESNVKIMFQSLPPGVYPIEVAGEIVEEDKHFPNPMVKFKAIKINKLHFVSNKD